MNLFRSILLAVTAYAASLTSAQARFGETLEEVTARYGPPIAVINKKFCEASEGGSYLFNLTVKNMTSDGGGISRTVQFRLQMEFKNNRVWLIRYNVKNLLPTDRSDLMSLNQGDVLWSDDITVKGLTRVFWRDQRSNSRFATHYRTRSMHVLQIVDAACNKALAEQRHQETMYIADMQDWTPLVERGQADNVPTPAAEAGAAGAATPTAPKSGPDAVRLPGL